MSLLTLRSDPPPPPEPKTRNRSGIVGIFERALPSGQKVTLEEAIAILKAGW